MHSVSFMSLKPRDCSDKSKICKNLCQRFLSHTISVADMTLPQGQASERPRFYQMCTCAALAARRPWKMNREGQEMECKWNGMSAVLVLVLSWESSPYHE